MVLLDRRGRQARQVGEGDAVGQGEADLRRPLVAARQALGRPDRHDLARDHHGHAVGQVLRLVHVVGRQDDGLAEVAERANRRPGLAPCVWIEAGRGLVEEEHVGVADEREREVEPPALAARERAGAGVAAGLELDELRSRRRSGSEREYQPACISSSSPTVRSCEIAGSCSTTPMRSRSSRSPLPGSRPRTETRPELGQAVALDDLDGRRLAGAVRPEQAEHLAGLDREADAAHRADVAVALVKVVEFDCGHDPRLWRASLSGGRCRAS